VSSYLLLSRELRNEFNSSYSLICAPTTLKCIIPMRLSKPSGGEAAMANVNSLGNVVGPRTITRAWAVEGTPLPLLTS
jgi:hypothetical protein